MSEVPVLSLPVRPNFMVTNGKTYLLEEVNQTPEDILKTVEGYYKDNLEVLREKVVRHISAESQDDLNKQVMRIERHLSSGVIMLPENLRANGSIMALRNNKVYETRVVLFKPSRLSCTMQRISGIVTWINTEMPRREGERYSKFVEWARGMEEHFRSVHADTSSVKIDVTINQDTIVNAMVVSFTPEENLIWGSPLAVHPHIHVGGNLCTGQVTARVFWDDVNFNENFNSLNPHSWANSSTVCAQNYRQLLKNQYFVEARVREEGGSAWRV